MVFKEPKIKWANSKARDLLLKYLRKKAMDGENKKYDPDKFRNRLGKFFIFSCNGCQDLNLKRRIFHFFVQRNPSNYLYWPLLAPIGPYWPLLAPTGPYRYQGSLFSAHHNCLDRRLNRLETPRCLARPILPDGPG